MLLPYYPIFDCALGHSGHFSHRHDRISPFSAASASQVARCGIRNAASHERSESQPPTSSVTDKEQ